MIELRPELPPLPYMMQHLPVDRGYPVPWFVARIGGRPDFRIVDPRKMPEAVRNEVCWICGMPLGPRVCFPIGPMCVVNRVTSEPPSHPACVEYAVKACPFMARPDMHRRDHDMPEGAVDAAGIHLKRNPGVMCLYTTRKPGFHLMDLNDGVLFKLWPPTDVTWWREGRGATVDEVMESVGSGLPALQKLAADDGPEAILRLDKMISEAMPLIAKARTA